MMPEEIPLVRSIAIHEAGHAVVGMAMGMRIMHICTKDAVCVPCMCCAPEKASYHEMVLKAGGYVAEELFLGEDAMYELEYEFQCWLYDPADSHADGVRFFHTAAELRKTSRAQQRIAERALAEARALLEAHAGDVEIIAQQALEAGKVDLCDYKLATTKTKCKSIT